MKPRIVRPVNSSFAALPRYWHAGADQAGSAR
jgi:hypothetical protein